MHIIFVHVYCISTCAFVFLSLMLMLFFSTLATSNNPNHSYTVFYGLEALLVPLFFHKNTLDVVKG